LDLIPLPSGKRSIELKVGITELLEEERSNVGLLEVALYVRRADSVSCVVVQFEVI
jgi:hypothetical protein